MKLPFKIPAFAVTKRRLFMALGIVALLVVIGATFLLWPHKRVDDQPSATPHQSQNSSAPSTTDSAQQHTTVQKSQAATYWWKPPLVASWQWQLASPPDPAKTLPVSVYDVDLFDTPASTVTALHRQGKKVICYMETGAWENYRQDAGSFPASVLGKTLGDYPDEKYLDIRRISILGPIMQKRLDLCKQKGFDAIEPDIDDAFLEGTATTGFPLTEKDQVAYDSYIAKQAHARGLSIGLKNGPDTQFVHDILPSVDWSLNEQCFEYSSCSALVSFIQAGKPVFEVEYNLATSDFCAQANRYNFNAMRKDVDLDTYRVACR